MYNIEIQTVIRNHKIYYLTASHYLSDTIFSNFGGSDEYRE